MAEDERDAELERLRAEVQELRTLNHRMAGTGNAMRLYVQHKGMCAAEREAYLAQVARTGVGPFAAPRCTCALEVTVEAWAEHTGQVA